MTRKNNQTIKPGGPLATAIERQQWDRIVLHTFVALRDLLRDQRGATIDDLLDLLERRRNTDDK